MALTIRILLVDDHPVVRRGITACLARYPGFLVVGEASNGQEALRKARELSPDVVLMDIDMPQMSGLAVTEVLHKELPQTKVLVLSTGRCLELVPRIIESGARGFVAKEGNPDDLARAVETVHSGELFFSADVAKVAVDQLVHRNGNAHDPAAPMTGRERQVLTGIADGLSNKEIGNRLGIGLRTVETHREHVMRKLNIHSVAGLTKYAVVQGLSPLKGGR
jgi:two-component system nitrate/nitrite response regulator NarL